MLASLQSLGGLEGLVGGLGGLGGLGSLGSLGSLAGFCALTGLLVAGDARLWEALVDPGRIAKVASTCTVLGFRIFVVVPVINAVGAKRVIWEECESSAVVWIGVANIDTFLNIRSVTDIVTAMSVVTEPAGGSSRCVQGGIRTFRPSYLEDRRLKTIRS